jgi:hypothetical protein
MMTDHKYGSPMELDEYYLDDKTPLDFLSSAIKKAP